MNLSAKTTIGTNSYKIKVAQEGGQVLVYRNKELTFSGQWFPNDSKLALFNCPFEDIRMTLEKVVSNLEDIGSVKWPLISQKFL